MSHNHVKDINECENGENDCSDDAICFNTEGSFECGCKKDLKLMDNFALTSTRVLTRK